MGWPIDMERKGCESMGCYTHFVTLNVHFTHDLDLAYICVSKLTIIVSDNGLLPGRRQAIIWTNAAILLIQTSGTNFSEILREIYTFSFKKMHLKMPSGKCRPSCLALNVLILVLKLIRLDGATKSYRFAM